MASDSEYETITKQLLNAKEADEKGKPAEVEQLDENTPLTEKQKQDKQDDDYTQSMDDDEFQELDIEW